MTESLKEKISRVTSELISIEKYNYDWVDLFEAEKNHLIKSLPKNLIRRVEHFGSTAIPGMPAKPVIDILIEVTCLEDAKELIVPILESKGYDYFWRPTFGDDTPPFYCWFIKRGKDGNRTHHIHMVEKDFPHWDHLLFRDYLIENPEIAREYADLKLSLLKKFPNDRIAYTNAKSDYINHITEKAKKYYERNQ